MEEAAYVAARPSSGSPPRRAGNASDLREAGPERKLLPDDSSLEVSARSLG
jgi:hypothetical protein